MADLTDTIAAIATPGGRGGIGIIRVSGPQCSTICTALAGCTPAPRQAAYTAFRDADGRVIDRGVVLYFAKPASYTGEDVLELHCHGGHTLPAMLLQRVLELGARLADPGEFTQRAFLNGKLDLVQAEAVADLVDSGSRRAARSAMRSLEGEFSARINDLVETVIAARVHVEGALDFPDEELELLSTAGVQQQLQECLNALQEILRRADAGRRLREGVHMVILGRPNVGKSSLLNRLTRSERAIVTDIPGTTRDLIEEQVIIGGVVSSIVDTAGLRESGDVIEQEGMERALAAAQAADILLLIEDAAATDSGDRGAGILQSLPQDKEVVYIHNKIDLVGQAPSSETGEDGRTVIRLSAKTGAGLPMLQDRLQELAGQGAEGEDVILARVRHVHALERARDSLAQGLQRLSDHGSLELLAEDLRTAQQDLGEITGAVSRDDLLGEIFSRFCIGK
jgi:tRNA modification GTPase